MRADLTKRADYAIRAMIALARMDGEGPLSARRIAVEMGIPARFLPQVMADLGRAGLVRAEPGRNGGHRLSRPADDIDLLEIIEAVEGDSRRRTCILRGGPCNAFGQCDVHAVFSAAQEAMLATLAEADLATVAGPPRPLGHGVPSVSPNVAPSGSTAAVAIAGRELRPGRPAGGRPPRRPSLR